jgi:hypothetical protein
VSSEALEPPFDREQILGRVKVVERGETTLYERALLAEVARLEQARNAAFEDGLRIARDGLAEHLTANGLDDRLRRAEAALAVAREREQPIREAARALADAVTDFCMNDAPAEWDGGSLGYTVGGLASLADDARAALVEPGRENVYPGLANQSPEQPGSASAAADDGEYDYEADIARGSNIRKPGERPWEASRRLRAEGAAADAPGETPCL